MKITLVAVLVIILAIIIGIIMMTMILIIIDSDFIICRENRVQVRMVGWCEV